MRLAEFIRTEMEPILAEWETFAACQLPAAQGMSSLALRDHAEQILLAIAQDVESQQPRQCPPTATPGPPQDPVAPATAAQTHGMLRATSGFDVRQMVGEFSALRASVLRLWLQAGPARQTDVDEMLRFDRAVDQALSDSVWFYSERVRHGRNLFLGMLGHDLRTPLQAIQLTAASLARLHAGATVQQAAVRLTRSAGRMQALLDDLVMFNRIQLGLGLTVERRDLDLARSLADEIAELQTAHPERRIDFSVEGDATGAWDGTAVQRMLGNLVDNAVKYGRPESPVQVRLQQAGPALVLTVANDGQPIDADVLDTLFDPLRRGLHCDAAGKDRSSMGLGLFIAREVARAHGGEIVARSGPDGTVFTAHLPRCAYQPT